LGVVDSVKKTQQQSHTASAHQTVTEVIKLKTGKKAISLAVPYFDVRCFVDPSD
jgi:hypothetical protein